jgi:hypothetical protein
MVAILVSAWPCAGRLLLCLPLLINAGCVTQSELTRMSLDSNDPKYESRACQNLLAENRVNGDAQSISMAATPALVVMSGGLLFPVAAANAGLGIADHADAKRLSKECTTGGMSAAERLDQRLTGSDLDIASKEVPN